MTYRTHMLLRRVSLDIFLEHSALRKCGRSHSCQGLHIFASSIFKNQQSPYLLIGNLRLNKKIFQTEKNYLCNNVNEMLMLTIVCSLWIFTTLFHQHVLAGKRFLVIYTLMMPYFLIHSKHSCTTWLQYFYSTFAQQQIWFVTALSFTKVLITPCCFNH